MAALVVFILLLIPEKPPVQQQEDPPPSAYYGSQEFKLDERGFMTYTGGNYATGIDVSGYQGEIQWQKVKQAGISFVFIRVGARGTTEGKLYPDSYAQSYYEGAKAAGLQVGAYFFSQAVTPEEAAEEAAFVLSQTDGWQMELPVVYDWEWGGEDSRTTGLDRQTLTQCAEIFCQKIRQAGKEPALYFNESQGLEQMDLDKLKQYPFWLAQYDGQMTFPYPIRFWQYSQTGRVDGITGNVDLNIWILDPF